MAIIEIREFFSFRSDYEVSELFVDLDGGYFMDLGGAGLMDLGGGEGFADLKMRPGASSYCAGACGASGLARIPALSLFLPEAESNVKL